MIAGIDSSNPCGWVNRQEPRATMPKARTGRIPTCSGTLKLSFYSDLQLIRSDLPTLWSTVYLIKILFKNCFY